MARRDYYEILGVERGVDDAQLKKAYRAKAMADHPDRNPGDTAAEERFKEAEKSLRRAVDALPERARVRYNHGLLLGQLGRKSEAERVLLEAHDLDPQDPSILQALTALYEERGDARRARIFAERWRTIHPSAPPPPSIAP